MKTTMTATLAALLLAAPALAQEPDEQAELRAKYEEALTHDFVAHGGWILDYDEARARAAAEGKLIFAYFTRSYAP